MARKYIATCEHCGDQMPPASTEQNANALLKLHQNKCTNRLREETRVITNKAVTVSDIRQWGRENGIPVGDRGRIPPALTVAYAKAHGEVAATVAKATADLTTVTVKLERTPVKKDSGPYRTNFCLSCAPGKPNKMHVYCKGTIHNAVPEGDRVVVCTCPNHEEDTAA